MIRRLLVPLLGSGLLLAAGAGSALAKCPTGETTSGPCSEIMVYLDIGHLSTYQAGTPASTDHFQAGTVKSFSLTVTKGEQPFEATSVVLTFTSDADGTSLKAPATATSVPGQWTAEVALPTDGTWSVFAQVVDPSGEEYRVPVESVRVAKPPAAPPVTKPATPSLPAVPILALMAAIAIAAVLGGAAIRDRSRRRTAAAPVSAITPDRA